MTEYRPTHEPGVTMEPADNGSLRVRGQLPNNGIGTVTYLRVGDEVAKYRLVRTENGGRVQLWQPVR